MTALPAIAWIRADIRASQGYRPEPLPEGAIRLDAMENPFDLPPVVHQRLGEEIAKIPLNRYPDGKARELKKVLASILGMKEEQMFLGNGSDEILLDIFLATQGPILLAEPTFSMYRILAMVAEKKVIGVPLSGDLALDMPRFIDVARRERPSLVVLSNPNNPTGRGVDVGDIRTLCENFSGGVLIDEAYYPFSRESGLPLQKDFKNLMILRTLSKLGLAGLRLGILSADTSIIQELDKVRLPYNLDAVTQRAALVICQEFFPLLEEQAEWIIRLRESFTEALSHISGVVPLPSRANFLLIRLEKADPSVVHDLLLSEKIIVRDVSGHHPLLSGCLRVTIGRKEENDLLLLALERILKGQS
jgi:histidinol-phosphate aminotransferase